MTIAIRIALDLDGVLTEHPRPLAHAANLRYGLDLPDHAFVDSAGLNVPLVVRQWVYGPDGPARELIPAPGAQEFLADMLEIFGPANVRIVTARPEEYREMTAAWLRSHGFPECQASFADDKVAVARQMGMTHALEDSLRHAMCYAVSGVRCVLLSDLPAPDGESRLIHRVPDLAAARLRLHEEAGLETRRLITSTSTSTGTSMGMNMNMDLDLTMTMNGNDQSELERGVLHMARMANGNGATPRSQRKRIVVSDMIDEQARALLSREVDIVDVDGTDAAALTEALHDADALIVRSETQVTREVLAHGPKLRVVARAGVGVDNIDVPSATEAGVLVLNAPGANAISAGEHTVALLLALSRCIPDANASTHAGRWERKRFKPFDLRGKTVGIVGLGRVGSVVAQRLRGFEMRLIGYDPYITRERFHQFGVEPVTYQTLLETADVVTFHVPATPETINMLDAAAIERLRTGAIVLNCARGEVVDAQALADALRSGKLYGAGVDVFPSEPARESPLFGLPNAILTPHIGGSSAEALAAVGEMIGTTTLAALRGEAVPNAVNLPPASLNAPDLQRLTHVASAAGHLLAVLRPHRPAHLQITVQGLVPGDVVEHVTAAALSEALRRWTDRRVTPVNARLVAEELTLRVTTAVGDADPARTPEFTFEVNGDSPHRVTVRWDRKDAGILEVDRFSLERPLAGDLLITHHHDRPGIVGRIGTILGVHHVNIAGMQVGRHHRGGEAIMVLNVDDAIPDEALSEIMAVEDVETVYVVSLPPALTPTSTARNGAVQRVG